MYMRFIFMNEREDKREREDVTFMETKYGETLILHFLR
jgi:hypothetical protein